MKQFDHWNKQKKTIDEGSIHKYYHPRDIWWCRLGTNIGFEQDGAKDTNERPVLILKGFSKQVCIVLPLTTSTKQNKYHRPLGIVDGREAFAIISQVRLIDTKRLSNKIYVLSKKTFDEIRKAVKDLL